ncbi:MAG: flagellar biosynthetic protein FliQ [Pyrinomonadaceae bacterium]|nr:flagellar biosynthetic protein FliQ [Pyrinomonadaceae bacterium]
MDIYVKVANEALWLILYLSILPLMASLIVGFIVSLFQALTQIQEQTLTFVPKVIATIIVLMICAPFILNSLVVFTENIFNLILQVGSGR